MEMVDDFPFSQCDKCRNMAPSAYASRLFKNNEVTHTVIHVECLNADICRELEKGIRKELTERG